MLLIACLFVLSHLSDCQFAGADLLNDADADLAGEDVDLCPDPDKGRSSALQARSLYNGLDYKRDFLMDVTGNLEVAMGFRCPALVDYCRTIILLMNLEDNEVWFQQMKCEFEVSGDCDIMVDLCGKCEKDNGKCVESDCSECGSGSGSGLTDLSHYNFKVSVDECCLECKDPFCCWKNEFLDDSQQCDKVQKPAPDSRKEAKQNTFCARDDGGECPPDFTRCNPAPDSCNTDDSDSSDPFSPSANSDGTTASIGYPRAVHGELDPVVNPFSASALAANVRKTYRGIRSDYSGQNGGICATEDSIDLYEFLSDSDYPCPFGPKHSIYDYNEWNTGWRQSRYYHRGGQSVHPFYSAFPYMYRGTNRGVRTKYSLNINAKTTSFSWGRCSRTSPCGICGGDCDSDNDCMPGLVCGKDNYNQCKWTFGVPGDTPSNAKSSGDFCRPPIVFERAEGQAARFNSRASRYGTVMQIISGVISRSTKERQIEYHPLKANSGHLHSGLFMKNGYESWDHFPREMGSGSGTGAIETKPEEDFSEEELHNLLLDKEMVWPDESDLEALTLLTQSSKSFTAVEVEQSVGDQIAAMEHAAQQVGEIKSAWQAWKDACALLTSAQAECITGLLSCIPAVGLCFSMGQDIMNMIAEVTFMADDWIRAILTKTHNRVRPCEQTREDFYTLCQRVPDAVSALTRVGKRSTKNFDFKMKQQKGMRSKKASEVRKHVGDRETSLKGKMDESPNGWDETLLGARDIASCFKGPSSDKPWAPGGGSVAGSCCDQSFTCCGCYERETTPEEDEYCACTDDVRVTKRDLGKPRTGESSKKPDFETPPPQCNQFGGSCPTKKGEESRRPGFLATPCGQCLLSSFLYTFGRTIAVKFGGSALKGCIKSLSNFALWLPCLIYEGILCTVRLLNKYLLKAESTHTGAGGGHEDGYMSCLDYPGVP